MKPLLPLLSLALSVLFLAAVAGLSEALVDNAAAMFKRPLSTVERCYANRLECRACRSHCLTARNNFFATSRSDVNIISLLRKCRQQISDRRTGMDDWCLNNERTFYATSAFRATFDTCKMDAITCADLTMDWAREQVRTRRMADSHSDYKLAHKMILVSGALRKERIALKRLHAVQAELKTRDSWYKTRVLDEIKRHIAQPTGMRTRFADPVFTNLDSVLKKTRQTDQALYRNDMLSGAIENQFVHQDTVEKVPALLKAISRVTKTAGRRSKEINAYMRQIRLSLESTHRAQLAATNLAYEATHVRDLRGEIVVLDKELLALFRQLKKERSSLSRATHLATRNRHKLVEAIRTMISNISRAQMRKRCSNIIFDPTRSS